MRMKDERALREKMDNVTKAYSLGNLSFDLVGRLLGLLKAGWYVDVEDGKIKQMIISDDISVMWRFVRPRPGLQCAKWHHFMFALIGIFPQKCKSCWKVVIRPRNVKELFQLHELMMHGTKLYCKCGMETREFVHGRYGGYVYTQSQEEGMLAWDEMRWLVSKFISPDVPVILKRYCSEFELKYGASDKPHPGRDSEEAEYASELWERLLDDWVVIKDDHPQTMVTQTHVMNKWLLEAHKFDPTAREFNIEEGTPKGNFYQELVTYHDKEGQNVPVSVSK